MHIPKYTKAFTLHKLSQGAIVILVWNAGADLIHSRYVFFILVIVLLSACDITRSFTIYNHSQHDKRIEISTIRHFVNDSVRFQPIETNHHWNYTIANHNTIHNSFNFVLQSGHKYQVLKSFGLTMDVVNFVVVNDSDTIYLRDEVTDNLNFKNGEYRMDLLE